MAGGCFSTIQKIYKSDDLSSRLDDLQGVYDNNQLFLGNMMFMSTLILGFVMTGTLLSTPFSGTENYDSEQLSAFLRPTVASALCALITLIIAFLVHARSVDVHSRKGVLRGTRALQRNLLGMLCAELSMYASLMCFGFSVGEFMDMQFVGPDICPFEYRDGEYLNYAREKSFCARLSGDFLEYSRAHCTGGQLPSGSSLLCEDLKTWEADERRKAISPTESFPIEYYYPWDRPQSTFRTSTFEKITVEVAEGICRSNTAKNLATNACAAPIDTIAKQQACASATMASTQAEQCIDDNAEDAAKCRRVCAVKGSQHPGELMKEWGKVTKFSCLIVLGLFAAYRLMNQFVVFIFVSLENYREGQGLAGCLWNGMIDEDLGSPTPAEQPQETTIGQRQPPRPDKAHD